MQKKTGSNQSNQRAGQNFSSIIMTVIFLFCILALILVAVLFWVPSMARDAFGPPTENLTTDEQFLLSLSILVRKDQLVNPIGNSLLTTNAVVNEGDRADVIAARLENQHLIPNASVFADYLRYKGYDRTIQQGEFELSPGMSPVDIAFEIQLPSSKYITIGMIDGWRVEEFANSLKTYGVLADEDKIITIARDPEAYGISSRLPIENGLEGFLMPRDDYEFEREGLTHEEIIYAMLLNFEASLKPEWETKFTENGLTLREAVVLASIVQKESIDESEMPRIASVFYNRLAAGMKLETDPTVQYALGYNQAQGIWWTNPLSYDDLKFDSPYNTYLYPGLPPGPICSPSVAALKAVATPETTNYFFFRAACDGSGTHQFAETYEQHLANACK